MQFYRLMCSCATLVRQTCFDCFCCYNKTGSFVHILNLFNPLKISTVVVWGFFFNIYKIVLTIFLFFHLLQQMSFLFVILGLFKWRLSTSSTICPLVKAKTYCKTCWTQMDPENAKKRSKKPQQSAAMPRVAAQWCRRLTTDV